MLKKKPSQSQIDDERKENELRDLIKLSEYSPLIKIKSLDSGQGHPPTRYQIEYTCHGYSKPGVKADFFRVFMTLPADYPRSLPIFQYDPKTPIYHNNVFTSYQGINQYICIGHDNSMPVGLPLREYVVGVGQMIQWRKPDIGIKNAVDDRPLVGKEPDDFPNSVIPPTPPPLIKASISILDDVHDVNIDIITSETNDLDKPIDIELID